MSTFAYRGYTLHTDAYSGEVFCPHGHPIEVLSNNTYGDNEVDPDLTQRDLVEWRTDRSQHELDLYCEAAHQDMGSPSNLFPEQWEAAAREFHIISQSRNRIVADVPFTGRFIVHCYPQKDHNNLIVVESPWERVYTIPVGTYLALSYLREKFGKPDTYRSHGGEMYAISTCIAILNNSKPTQI